MELPVLYDNLEWHERRAVRDAYIEHQQGLCYWCNQSLDTEPIQTQDINLRLFPKGFFNYPVHLQHCRKTGLTEGAVHAYCNAVMWQYHHR
jgi:hypothetical protein